MLPDLAARQFRLLMLHCMLWSLGMSLASGFVDAYILHLGFGMAAALGMHAILLLFRFGMRFILLPLVRRLGMHRAVLLGAAIAALQFLPLINARQPLWLAAWIAIVSVGECLYWPIYHAATAVCGGRGRRGRQIALRQMASTVISIIGPVAGGLILTRLGPAAEFGTGSGLSLLAIIPLFWLRRLDLGAVPSVRGSVLAADRIGLFAFAADGWMSAGLAIAWPMILFQSLNANFTALGCAGSIAAVAGAVAGLGCGIAIDRGHRHWLSRAVMIALLVGIAIRVVAAWAPWAALTANALAAAISGVYVPVLMSMIYDRAKRSGSAYQFHLSAEAGWDAGCILGCVATAGMVLSGAPATFAVLPSVLGVLLLDRCVRAEPSLAPQRKSGLAAATA
jgi:DHA1 family inner membrane transport protein